MDDKKKNSNLPDFDTSDQITPTSEITRIHMLELQLKEVSDKIKKLSNKVDGKFVSSTNLKILTTTIASLLDSVSRIETELQRLWDELSDP